MIVQVLGWTIIAIIVLGLVGIVMGKVGFRSGTPYGPVFRPKVTYGSR